MKNNLMELTFESDRSYSNPYIDLDLDVVFTSPDGQAHQIPGFWAGSNMWKVRFAGDQLGEYEYRTVCSDAANQTLHNQTGTVEVTPYGGDNPLHIHGRLAPSDDRRYLQHADGTPFFWMADTWWMGLCHRISWPLEFQELAADRIRKGFNVIQIVAGLYPDMPLDFDPRGANEAGYPLNTDHTRINPEYFDMADLRVAHLVRSGLMPSIVGCWGYWLLLLGQEKMKRFWRYLVARWGAHPVVWCLAGEATMAYPLSADPEGDAQRQRDGWTELARYVREIDGHGNAVTIHPTRFGREQVNDPKLLDLEWLQTGHHNYQTVPYNVQAVAKAVALEPRMPVLVSEVNYEGIRGQAWQDVQRQCFWMAIVNGACGHTYGANGIWQVNQKDKPYGPSPHGRNWGVMPWQDAANLPGSYQLGAAAKFLRGIPWWRMEAHPEWTEGPWSPDDAQGVHVAGVSGELRLYYFPMRWDPVRLLGFEQDITYTARYFDPVTGDVHDAGIVEPEPDGSWMAPPIEVGHDWVLVVEKEQ